MVRKMAFALIGIAILATAAQAAVSSPCTGRPKEPAKPQVYEEREDFRRDILDNLVPTKTYDKGSVPRSKATEYRERIAP